MSQRVTLRDIAQKVGVSKSTVSDVLRQRVGKVKVSENTKDKIFKTAKELEYEPNSAARALITGKTNNIGFLLSSETTLGLANTYFASLMSGVGDACKTGGYNCIVSSYDLSSVKKFVMPSKLKRRNVDGFVISGNIRNEVVQMFIDSGLPFVLVGENADFPVDGVLSVARDLAADWVKVFRYLYDNGHRHIAVGGIETERGMRLLNEAKMRFRTICGDPDVRFFAYDATDCAEKDVFNFANNKARTWYNTKDRPTAVVGHDQWCLGFLSGVLDAGASCPADVSIISTSDTVLCQWCRPSISAVSLPLYESGKAVTDLLIKVIEKDINWIDAHEKTKTIWEDRKLVIRNSSGPCEV
jgi:LacI family transcriptional regulator